MRNSLLVSLFFLFLTPMVLCQSTEIQPTNGIEFCCGFTSQSYAHIQLVSPPPIPLPSYATFTYIWTAKHENGTTWIWHTNLDHRMVPIPWEGEYRIRVMVLYVRKYQNYPFASFWSNSIKIHGKQCSILEKSSSKKR